MPAETQTILLYSARMCGDLPAFVRHEAARFQGQMYSANDWQRMQQLPISVYLRSSVECPVFQYELHGLT